MKVFFEKLLFLRNSENCTNCFLCEMAHIYIRQNMWLKMYAELGCMHSPIAQNGLITVVVVTENPIPRSTCQ